MIWKNIKKPRRQVYLIHKTSRFRRKYIHYIYIKIYIKINSTLTKYFVKTFRPVYGFKGHKVNI